MYHSLVRWQKGGAACLSNVLDVHSQICNEMAFISAIVQVRHAETMCCATPSCTRLACEYVCIRSIQMLWFWWQWVLMWIVYFWGYVWGYFWRLSKEKIPNGLDLDRHPQTWVTQKKVSTEILSREVLYRIPVKKCHGKDFCAFDDLSSRELYKSVLRKFSQENVHSMQ